MNPPPPNAQLTRQQHSCCFARKGLLERLAGAEPAAAASDVRGVAAARPQAPQHICASHCRRWLRHNCAYGPQRRPMMRHGAAQNETLNALSGPCRMLASGLSSDTAHTARYLTCRNLPTQVACSITYKAIISHGRKQQQVPPLRMQCAHTSKTQRNEAHQPASCSYAAGVAPAPCFRRQPALQNSKVVRGPIALISHSQ